MLSPSSAAGTACGRALPASAVPADVRAVLESTRSTGPTSDYVYDPSVARQRARELRAAMPEWATLLYAMKANAFEPVVAELLSEGGVDGIEVASLHEAEVAAGLLPDGRPLAAAGPAKHPRLLAGLLDRGVSVIHVESPTELRRVAAVADERGVRVPVALRVNPARVAVTGTLAMGGGSSAFGIPEPDVADAVGLARRLGGIELVGFHLHAVSGNRDATAHAAYIGWALDWAVQTARSTGTDLRWLDVGGGLGVSYGGDDPLDLAVLSTELDRLSPPSSVEVVLEPGRWLAADCGWYAAEVIDVKDSYGDTYVVVRGGIGGYTLPGTDDFPYPVAVVPVEGWHEPFDRPERRDVTVTVSGELCTPEDVLARDVAMDRIRVGDLLVFPQAGAYGYEFALRDFLGHPAPGRRLVERTAVDDRRPTVPSRP